MIQSIHPLIHLFQSHQFCLANEESLKQQMSFAMTKAGIPFYREHPLDKRNRPDFISLGHAIEVKIHGSAMAIYRQCVRYCEFDQILGLILVTNRSLGFPEEIKGKPCHVVNLGRAWL